MSDILDDLQNMWDDAKKDKNEHSLSAKDLIALSKQKMRKAVWMQVGTIAILTITLLGISAFFIYVAQFRNLLSHIGIFLMTGGLVVRILIEVYSIYRSSKIDLSLTASNVNKRYLNFFDYRSRIHGPVTIGILVAYSVGFYLLIPEFANYFSTVEVTLIALSYLLAAAIFGYFIRKGIRDEMELLRSVLQLQDEMADEKSV
jgi:cation transport ATPase